ncbi:MAG: FAD:protein FMN transferase [bacterium]
MPKFVADQIIMNTSIKITAYSDYGTVDTWNLINQAFDNFLQVVKKFSRFDPNSELSQLNQNQGKPTQLSPELFEIIHFALNLAKQTLGKYDPTVLDLLEVYGYKNEKDFQELNDPYLMKKIKKIILERPKYSEIQLDQVNHTITLQKKQRLDLGSLGKGYAIKLAAKTLSPTQNFLIEAGGDIFARGKKENNLPWQVGLLVQQDDEPQMLGKITLTNQSIASSGSWANRVRFFHHLLNPKNGLPENYWQQIFVLDPDPLLADAWATALFLAGTAALKLAESKKLTALLLDFHGKITKTEDFPKVSVGSWQNTSK